MGCIQAGISPMVKQHCSGSWTTTCRDNTHIVHFRSSSFAALACSLQDILRGCNTVLEIGFQECAGAVADVVRIGHLLY